MITLVNTVAGSHLYGLNHTDSDLDTMGIGVNTLAESVNLAPVEQVGDSDHVVYELRKWVRLAAKGNPTILQMLWTPEPMWSVWHDEWPRIQQQLRKLIPSQACRPSFIGYMQQQKQKMLNDRGQRETLKQQFGFDTKFAMHAVRLGFQGLEVLQHGRMQLPMSPTHRAMCMDIRHGEWTEPQVVAMIDSLTEMLRTTPSDLPLGPDYPAINTWLAHTYEYFWRHE